MSRDSIGRRYPLAVFMSVPLALISSYVGCFAVACAGFLRDAGALLDHSDEISLDQLRRDARLLCPPRPQRWRSAAHVCEALLARASLGSLQQRLFAGEPARCAYALSTARQALSIARKRDGDELTLALHCPLVNEHDLLFWLAFTQAQLVNKRPPSVYWRFKTPQLLLELGRPQQELYRALSGASATSERVWGLRSDISRLLDRAVDEAPPAWRELQHRIDEPSASLAAVIRAYAPEHQAQRRRVVSFSRRRSNS